MAMEKKLTDNEPISKPKPTKKDNRIGKYENLWKYRRE